MERFYTEEGYLPTRRGIAKSKLRLALEQLRKGQLLMLPIVGNEYAAQIKRVSYYVKKYRNRWTRREKPTWLGA